MSDTTIISSERLNEYRNLVQDMPETLKAQALEALNTIEACDGDLEAAANKILSTFLVDSGAVERHGGSFDAAMTEYLSTIK